MRLISKLIIIVIVVCILSMLITNPTLSDFKSYTHLKGFNSEPKRKGNYIIFSTYQCGDYSYLGIFRKFLLTDSPTQENFFNQ